MSTLDYFCEPDESGPSAFYAATEGVQDLRDDEDVTFFIDADERLPYRHPRKHGYKLTFVKRLAMSLKPARPWCLQAPFSTVANEELIDGYQCVSVLDPSRIHLFETAYVKTQIDGEEDSYKLLVEALNVLSFSGWLSQADRNFSKLHHLAGSVLASNARLNVSPEIRRMLYAQLLGSVPADVHSTSEWRRMRQRSPNEPESLRINEALDFLLQESPITPEFGKMKLHATLRQRAYDIIVALLRVVRIESYEISTVMGSCYQVATLYCAREFTTKGKSYKKYLTFRINLSALLLSVLQDEKPAQLP